MAITFSWRMIVEKVFPRNKPSVSQRRPDGHGRTTKKGNKKKSIRQPGVGSFEEESESEEDDDENISCLETVIDLLRW